MRLKDLLNIQGWRTKRHLIVLESDDWGSIRMPSNDTFQRLCENGIDLLNDKGLLYNKFDSLATSEDLSSLFDVLSSVRDNSGRTAVFTPVSVVANPDFEKIRESDFNEYYFEAFTNTLKRYPGCENSFRLWEEGIRERLFVPQFHGREHLNVYVWLMALKGGIKNVRDAFNYNMWGISTSSDPRIGIELQAAFDFLDPGDIQCHKEIIKSGLDLFEELFKYKAVYFVPPNGLLNKQLEETCFEGGIRYLLTSTLYDEPIGEGKTRRRLHYLGQRSRSGITYYIRNCFFEPVVPGTDWVDSCLREIKTAFLWSKPAIISSHRVNYIGALESKNRRNGIAQLSRLLKNIVKFWPNIEFLTSAELAEYLSQEGLKEG